MYTNKNLNLSEKIREKLFKERIFLENPLTEECLAECFSTSRTPIRDALKGLENEGIIERRKKKGVYLKIPSVSEISAYYDVRAVLESFAVRAATEYVVDKDIKYLLRAAHDYDEAVVKGDRQKMEFSDGEFHGRIIEMAHNPLLTRIMKNFRLLERTFKMNLADDKNYNKSKTSPYKHQHIVESLRVQNKQECEQLMRSHIQWSKRNLIARALNTSLE